MFKPTIAAAVLTLVIILTTMPTYAATPASDCNTMGESIHLLGDLRDDGVSADTVYEYLVNVEGIAHDIVISMITAVYLEGADLDPAALEVLWLTVCYKGLV
tara:strand:+ start:1175 stop:1480 length:306 start_codon:yes stop_codon:yes gene_type:complete